MRRFPLMFLLLLIFASSIFGQSILLKTGQKIETQGVRLDRDLIMARVQVGSSSGEVGYKLEQIAKIEFPEPRALKSASDLLAQNEPEKALAEIEPVVKYYEPFKRIPGAWWAQAAAVKVSVLTALERIPESERLANELQNSKVDAETGRSVKLRLVTGLIQKKEFEKAIATCKDIIANDSEPSILAEAWIKKGDVLLAQRHFDSALLAYLHVPIFYADEKTFVPAALLGSGRAYWRLDDAERAKKSLNELITSYPKAPEAALAQSELQRIQNR